MNETVEILINEERHQVPTGATVASVLEHLGVGSGTAVVEHNGAIVSRTQYDLTKVQGGDRLELVRFMGGG